MNSCRIAVIMAGGSGERFWPLSTATRPKQLLKLTRPDATMLEEAVERILPLVAPNGVFVATTSALYGPISATRVLPEDHIWAEPLKRNTLGAFCWVVANLIATGRSKATVGMLTADHLIQRPEEFRKAVETAMQIAEDHEGIVTIGIRPSRPETGYGYVELDEESPVGSEVCHQAWRVKAFREKPNQSTAEDFIRAGNFLWNGGMFFFTVPVFLKELRAAVPEAYDVVLAIAEALKAGDQEKAIAEFTNLPDKSVDYAVMEQAENMFVVQATFPWDDVGAWDALERTQPLDSSDNATMGDALLIDSRGNIVVNESGLKVALLGVTDLVVAVTDQGILVCHKKDAQRVRAVAQSFKEKG